MQMPEAAKLRRLWKEAGNKPCLHTEVDREYYLGAHTGDLVCTMCGAMFVSWQEVEQERTRQRARAGESALQALQDKPTPRAPLPPVYDDDYLDNPPF